MKYLLPSIVPANIYRCACASRLFCRKNGVSSVCVCVCGGGKGRWCGSGEVIIRWLSPSQGGGIIPQKCKPLIIYSRVTYLNEMHIACVIR